MTREELREKVAEALLAANQNRITKEGCDILLSLNDAHREAADAAIALVLEEAARVADEHVFGGSGVAAAIRALKG